MPKLPGDYREWQQPKKITPRSIIDQYERGFAGCIYNPEDIERLASYGASSGEDVCAALGYEETAAGELILPYLPLLEEYPTIYPGPAQQRGDCVSHCSRNAALISLAGDVVAGTPDPISGHVEQFPSAASAAAEKAGLLCTELCYHYRGHKGDGWFCPGAADIMVRKTGAVLRDEYDFADLTKYDHRFAGKYYKESQIPEEIQNASDDNLIQDATQVHEPDAMRDLLARGFGISTCGGESWSNQRDANGYSKRTSKGWAHAIALIGWDDRPDIHRKYGGPLGLLQNSWGVWNKGPTKIMGTSLHIPAGCWWSKWSDMRRRNFTALAGVTGWERELLPDLVGGFR